LKNANLNHLLKHNLRSHREDHEYLKKSDNGENGLMNSKIKGLPLIRK
jgi:hypothetical protein